MVQVARARTGILGWKHCIVKLLPMAQVTRAKTGNSNRQHYIPITLLLEAQYKRRMGQKISLPLASRRFSVVSLPDFTGP